MKRIVVSGAILLTLALCAPRAEARLQQDLPGGGSIELNSLLNQEVAFSTATQPNRLNLGHLNTDHNTLNFVASRGESLITLAPGSSLTSGLGLDNLTFFAHTRFYADTAPYLDSALNHVNMFSADARYRGNGWAVNSVGTSEWEADLTEAYADIKKGGLWLRVGRQVQEYGGGLLTRAINEVDSLDFRRNLFIDNLLTEWQDQEVAQWTARLNYSFAIPAESFSNSSMTAWISPDTQPTVLTAPGTWYAVLPSFVDLNDADNIVRARHRLSYGAMLATNYDGLDISALYYSTPQHFGQFYAKQCSGPAARFSPFGFTQPGCIPGTPFKFDPEHGVPFFAGTVTPPQLLQFGSSGTLPPPNPKVLRAANQVRLNLGKAEGAFLRTYPGLNPNTPQGLATLGAIAANNPPLTLVVDRHFPREDVYAMLFSYSVNEDFQFPGAALLNGDQLRIDIDYKPSRAWTDAVASQRGFRQGAFDAVAEIERYVKFSSQVQAAYLLLEYWYSSAGDLFEHNLRQEGFGGGWHLLAAGFNQSLFNSRFSYTGIVVAEMVGKHGSHGGPGWLHESVISYKPSSSMIYQCTYNFFSGDRTNLMGVASQYDEVILGVTYKF